MPDLVKVTMNLTPQDVGNIETIHRIAGTRSKAHAVSTALSLCKFIFEALLSKPGTQLLLRGPDGKIERIVMPELVNNYASRTENVGVG